MSLAAQPPGRPIISFDSSLVRWRRIPPGPREPMSGRPRTVVSCLLRRHGVLYFTQELASSLLLRNFQFGGVVVR